MTRRPKHRPALFALLLSIAFLLCGCQLGTGTLYLPDVPSNGTSQAEALLVEALNQEYSSHFTEANHFIHGSDSSAEKLFQYLEENCGGDAFNVAKLLSRAELAKHGDELAARLSISPTQTCRVSYAALDSATLDSADHSAAAHTLFVNRAFLSMPDEDYDPAFEYVGLASGTIGGQAFVVAVFVS